MHCYLKIVPIILYTVFSYKVRFHLNLLLDGVTKVNKVLNLMDIYLNLVLVEATLWLIYAHHHSSASCNVGD